MKFHSESIISLPDNMIVKRYLDVSNCINLKKLPRNLNVGKLFIDNTNIKELPNDLVVHDYIVVDESKVIEFRLKYKQYNFIAG